MKHIMVIDDCESDRLLLGLVAGEFAVVMALEDPDEAITALAGYKQFPDLILVDARLRNIGGFEVARRIKMQYPYANVVLMSGSEMYADDEFPFMLKALTIEELEKSIKEHLNGTQSRR